MVQAVGLADCKDSRVDTLSRGLKRRLQVALALLGASKVVVLGNGCSGVVL